MEYRLIRSDRKTVSIEITDELAVLVRAPERMPQSRIDGFVSAHSDWIDRHLKIKAERLAAHPAPDEAEVKRLRKRARTELPGLVEKYSAITGLVPTGIKITSAQKRFGSCSSRNSICFSYRLMAYPDEAVEYVVLHELAHIRYKNHGAEFYELIGSFMPDFRKREKLLR